MGPPQARLGLYGASWGPVGRRVTYEFDIEDESVRSMNFGGAQLRISSKLTCDVRGGGPYRDFDRIDTPWLVVGGEGAHRDVRFEGVHPRAVVDVVSYL